LGSYQDSDEESSKRSSEYSSGSDHESESSSGSLSLSGDINIAHRAIRKAIKAQSAERDSSKSTMKVMNNQSYQSNAVVQSDHIKLTKLKKEIYQERNLCKEIRDDNKVKSKEKKDLEQKLQKIQQELEDIMNSKETYDTGSDTSGYVEQKAVQVTSIAQDLNHEECKQLFGDFMKNTSSSGVDTDYIKKVNDRKKFNATGRDLNQMSQVSFP